MDPIILAAGGAVALVTAGMTCTALSCFKKCPPDHAMIISGMGTAYTDSNSTDFRVVLSGGAIVLPVVQHSSFISMQPFNVPLAPHQCPVTSDGIPVKVRGVAKVAVGKTVEDVAAAATQILGKSNEEMADMCADIFETHVHEAASQMNFSTMANQLHDTGTKIAGLTAPDLKALGLIITLVTVKEVQKLVPDMVANT